MRLDTMKQKQRVTEKVIRKVTEEIIKSFQPQKIILFGSLVWSEPRVDSDLDLFIIKDIDLRRDERSVLISRLFPYRDFPLDVLVYTPKEVELSLARKNSFIHEILTKGKVRYDRESKLSRLV